MTSALGRPLIVSAKALKLLRPSSSGKLGPRHAQRAVDFSDDVSLDAAHDFTPRFALRSSPSSIGFGPLVIAHGQMIVVGALSAEFFSQFACRVTDGAIGRTFQIGLTPCASRCASMKPTITSTGGRVPPSQNMPTPCAGSRSPGATPGSPAPAP